MKNLKPGVRTWLYNGPTADMGRIFVIGTEEHEKAVASGLWHEHWMLHQQNAVEVPMASENAIAGELARMRRRRGRPSRAEEPRADFGAQGETMVVTRFPENKE